MDWEILTMERGMRVFHQRVNQLVISLKREQCLEKTRAIGLVCRYRAKKELIFLIGAFLTRRPVFVGECDHTRNYLLRDTEVQILRPLYTQSGLSSAKRRRLMGFRNLLAKSLYITDLRRALVQLGVRVVFRNKQTMLEVLCHVWFGKQKEQDLEDQIVFRNESIPTGTECLICMNEVSSEDNLRFRCHCVSWYHPSCLRRWGISCPTCRKIDFILK